MNISAAVETITPEKAQGLLGDHENYRILRPKKVAEYASAMGRGEWRITSDAIGVFEDGELANGQHRLHALIAHGRPLEMLVVRGLSRDSGAVTDRGSARKLQDELRRQGEPYCALLASSLRVLFIYREHGVFAYGGAYPTVPQLLAQLKIEPLLRDSLPIGSQLRQNGIYGITSTLASTLHYVLSRADKTDADEFFVQLASGANLSEDDAIYHYRRQFVNPPRTRGHATNAPTNLVAALGIKAFNAWSTGTPMRALRWRASEGFPQIRPYDNVSLGARSAA